MQNNTLTMAYNSETGTHTAIVFIPMQQTGTIIQPKVHSKNTQNGQPQKPQIQRTYRQKPYNDIKPENLNLETFQNKDIITETKTEPEDEEPKIIDSMLKRRMRPYTSGHRRYVKQQLNKSFIGTSAICEDVDEVCFQKKSHYTPRTRQFTKPVAHNILTLPEYKQQKKAIMRSFDNAVKMNGAAVFAELNFNPTR